MEKSRKVRSESNPEALKKLDDGKIIGLLYERNEKGLDAIQQKYGSTMQGIAFGICGDRQDSEEVVNDALGAVWGSIPPQYPDPLSAYVFRIVRNLALTRVRTRSAAKRSGVVVPIDELTEAIVSGDPRDENAEAVDSKQISDAVNEFLSRQDRTGRVIFIRRYWYSDGVTDIAKAVGLSRVAVSARLSRMRDALLRHLKEKGIEL